VVLKYRAWYYIDPMYHYYLLTLFLILIKKLTKSQTFIPDLPEIGHIKAKQGPNMEKTWFLKSWNWYYIVSMYKYYKLTLFLVLIGKFDQKSNFSPIGLNWAF